MRSTLTIVTPATETDLLTIEEMRAAAGVTDGTQDAALRAIADGITDDIMSACNIAIGLGGEPTIMQETLLETFYDWPGRCSLVLARRHNVAISSVTINESEVDTSDYSVNAEDGILYHNCGTYCPHSRTGFWLGQKIIVGYTAGFTTVPAGLKQVAMELMGSRYSESHRDDFVKSETIEIPGVETKRRDYWVGSMPGRSSSDGPIPGFLSGRLKRFKNMERSIG